VCADVNDIFMQLTGLGKASKLRHLWQSPFTLHTQLLAAIRREADAAASGRKAGIVAKMNSLLDTQVIDALYAASGAGVRIDLIVRGVCGLRPGIAGMSENIRVRSVIGRFLEHHRVFHFVSSGETYISSADWMERNFFRRIEVCLPILDARLKKRVVEEGLRKYLDDSTQAWDMDAHGHYRLRGPGKGQTARCAQTELLAELASAGLPELPDRKRALRPRRKAKAAS